jgi:hypothetical protein
MYIYAIRIIGIYNTNTRIDQYIDVSYFVGGGAGFWTNPSMRSRKVFETPAAT